MEFSFLFLFFISWNGKLNNKIVILKNQTSCLIFLRNNHFKIERNVKYVKYVHRFKFFFLLGIKNPFNFQITNNFKHLTKIINFILYWEKFWPISSMKNLPDFCHMKTDLFFKTDPIPPHNDWTFSFVFIFSWFHFTNDSR